MLDVDYMRAISTLTRSQIDEILDEWDRIGREKFLALHKVNRAAKFKIKIDDKEYDAKAVLVVVLRRFNSELKNLKPVAIDSNEQTIAAPLRNLGFEIIEVSEAQLVNDEEVAAEVRAAFQRLQSRLGDVWRLTQQGMSHREVADVMKVPTDKYVGKLLRFARAIELGDLPTARTMVIECCREFEDVLKKEGDAMSARTRDALNARRRDLLSRMPDLQEKSKSGDEESMNQKLKDLVMGFDSAVEDARLIFAGDNDVLPAVFARGLLAKRFCILGGLAGSGKTQLAKAFGKWLGQTDHGEQRYLIVPVRADWTSPDPLLGFEDALGKPSIDGRKSWNIPEPCKFMINAANEPGRLWLLVLDEMNIAHVERYFSDVLSGIESGEPVIPNVQLEQDGNWRIPSNAAEKIPLPANLVIVGTVNIDETTYQFSPKVLDRSFTFEFRVQTEELSNSANRPASLASATADELDLLNQIACDDEWHLNHLSRVEDIYLEIKAVHAMLSKHNFEFGHRAMYEILRFAVLCEQSGLEEEKTIDWAIMTKILPRIHGSAQQLHKLLEEFKTYATNKKLNLTLKKVNRMSELARANGFASFAE